MTEIIEMGTVSSRGQICIPNDIRVEMGLEEGNRVMFMFGGDALLIKKVTKQTFAEITKPLKEEAKKVGFLESEVDGIIHRFRKQKK